MTYLWPIHELQVLSTSSSQNSLIPLVSLLQNMERSLLRQFHLDFPHKNRGQDIRSAGCSVLRSPQPTPPSRGAAEQTCSKASTAAVSDLDRQMPQISHVLRIQISPGVIGATGLWQITLRMDRWIRIPICWWLLIWGNEKSMFQCRAKLLNIHRFAWSHSAQPCYFQNSQKKNLGTMS